jgi:hypothetical protein
MAMLRAGGAELAQEEGALATAVLGTVTRSAKADQGGQRPPWHARQRIGGAYCSPPRFHRLFTPRGKPIGVMLRSHTSP